MRPTKGGNALTGLKKMIGTGSVAKGAAATVGNFTSDKLASLVGFNEKINSDIQFGKNIAIC